MSVFFHSLRYLCQKTRPSLRPLVPGSLDRTHPDPITLYSVIQPPWGLDLIPPLGEAHNCASGVSVLVAVSRHLVPFLPSVLAGWVEFAVPHPVRHPGTVADLDPVETAPVVNRHI